MQKFSELVIKFRVVIIFITVAITIILGYFVKDIKINSDVSSYLPKDNPIVKTLNYIGENYGGKFLAVVAIESNEVFSKETIENVNYLTSQFKLLDNISYIMSLTNILDIKKIEDGMEVGKLIDEYELPKSDEELQKLKKYALSKDMYRGSLVSEDSKVTLIICRIKDGSNVANVSAQLKEIIKKANIKGKVYYAGEPFHIMELSGVVSRDLKVLIILAFILIIIVLFLSFHSIRGVVIPIFSIFISIIWIVGIMSILKIPLTMISNIIPVVLIAVGSAYCIHVISKFDEDATIYKDRITQARISLSEVGIPVFLAAITTVVGFISFIFGSYLTLIRDFGIFSALGIFFIFVISVTFIPSVLSLLPLTKEAKLQRRKDNYANRFMSWLANWIPQNEKFIIIFGSIICLIGALGIPRIKQSVDMVKFFKPKSDIRIASEMMRDKFGGDSQIQILVKGDIQDPKVLKEIKNLQEFIKSQKYIYNPQSIADLFIEMNDVMGEGRTIPDTRDKIGNLWFFIEGEEMINQMVNPNRTEAIIQATMSNVDDPKIVQNLIKSIKEYISQKTDRNIATFDITGLPLVNEQLNNSITRSQLYSLIIALIFVFICMSVLLRSFVRGLIGLVPIIFTLLVIFGIMGLAAIPLDLATVLLGGISIGIGVDYPIHFINRFRNEIKNGNEINALTTTLKTTGVAILINVISVMMGFLVLTMANLVPLQNFGLLIAITMISAGISTITILPAIILLNKSSFITESTKKEVK